MHSMGADVAAFDLEIDGKMPVAPIYKARVDWDGALPVIPSWADQLLLASKKIKMTSEVGQPKVGSNVEKILALINDAGAAGVSTRNLEKAAKACMTGMGATSVNTAVGRLRQLRLIVTTRDGAAAVHRAARFAK